MPGSQDRWDQLEDPRESTVDLPRLAGMSRLERPSNGDTAADQPLPEYHPGGKDPLPRTGEPAVPPEDPRSMLDHAEPTEPEDPRSRQNHSGTAAPEKVLSTQASARPAAPDELLTSRDSPSPAPERPRGRDQEAAARPQQPAAKVPDLAAWEESLFARPPAESAASAADRTAPAAANAAADASRDRAPAGTARPESQPGVPTAGPAAVDARLPGRIGADLPAWLLQMDRPARGSPADLWLRLERLPPGHPSSPYNDDGSRKPAPQRLKHLELPLTADDRDVDATRPSRLENLPSKGADPDHATDRHLTDRPSLPAPDATAEHADVLGGTVLGSTVPDRPAAGGEVRVSNGISDGVVTPPGNSTAEHATAPVRSEEHERPGAMPGSRDLPDRTPFPVGSGLPERGIPQPNNGLAERTALPGGSAPPERSGPAAGDTAAGHPALRPAGPDAPRTGDDGSWAWRGARLTPEQCHVADRVHAQYRAAEGQNVFGGYGRSGLTPAMRRIEAQLDHGQLAPETERYALRDGNVFRRQLADLIARHPDKPPEELAYRIVDTIRYAYIFDAERYTEGTWQVHRRLKAHGFELEERQNGWAGTERRQGIRSRWRDPAHNLPFEVQFHITASWDAQRRGDMAAIAAPPGCAQIGDYRKEEPSG